MFPLTRVPFWHRFFEPQPYGYCCQLGSQNSLESVAVCQEINRGSIQAPIQGGVILVCVSEVRGLSYSPCLAVSRKKREEQKGTWVFPKDPEQNNRTWRTLGIPSCFLNEKSATGDYIWMWILLHNTWFPPHVHLCCYIIYIYI